MTTFSRIDFSTIRTGDVIPRRGVVVAHNKWTNQVLFLRTPAHNDAVTYDIYDYTDAPAGRPIRTGLTNAEARAHLEHDRPSLTILFWHWAQRTDGAHMITGTRPLTVALVAGDGVIRFEGREADAITWLANELNIGGLVGVTVP